MTHSDVVIRVEGLGKKYALHHEKSERYTALRDVVARQARAASRLLNPFTLAGQLRKAQREAAQERAESGQEFWALKDVSFEIHRGERVGIIGRNGAGKSTLLKILSRITEPSTGRVEVRGRVASLLEVGTGFHPELTGRENIYLNGAILGMTRREIRAKFDEIVDFAEVEKFLDTPVKRYSSGMYVRLAFAVAAHLEPEILVVDEVLAVGDANFQRKCLGKMNNITSGGGRSIVFVSHDLRSVSNLCDKSLLLAKGSLIAEGDTAGVVSKYMEKEDSGLKATFVTREGMPTITGVKVEHDALREGRLEVAIDFISPFSISTPIGGVVVKTLTGEPIWGSNNRFAQSSKKIASMSRGRLLCQAGKIPLRSGKYMLSAWLGDMREDFDAAIDCIFFELLNKDESLLMPPAISIGYFCWNAEWTTPNEN